MMSYEWTYGGTTCNHTRHRCLNLEEAEVIEVTPEVIDHPCTCEEDIARTRGHDEIEVTLAVPGLLVLKTKVGGWELVQIGCKENHGRGGDAELALLTGEGYPMTPTISPRRKSACVEMNSSESSASLYTVEYMYAVI
jgi:hypothetical protein